MGTDVLTIKQNLLQDGYDTTVRPVLRHEKHKFVAPAHGIPRASASAGMICDEMNVDVVKNGTFR